VKKIQHKTFSTLEDLRKYSIDNPEYPPIDNNDWTHPDYTTFIKMQTPGYFERFGRWIGLKKPLWTIEAFNSLLKTVTKERELSGYIGRFVVKIDPDPGTEFVIFGDLHAGLHSLVRDLTFLELRGVISENLVIKPNCYFIFNGNVIDQTPYSLETLTVLLQLMQKNPGKVLYIRGSHEDKEQWHNFELKDELMIRAQHIAATGMAHGKIPLSSSLNAFFNTLPLALYIIADRSVTKINVVRVSHYGVETKELKEKRFAGFLDIAGDNEPQTFKINNTFTSKKKVNIKAFITGEKLDIYYKKTPGLRSLGKEKGVDTWAVLSSPIDVHRRLYEFFYDAFAILTIYPQVNDWTIALYNQDVRSKLGFQKSKMFNLFTGLDITGKTKEVLPSKKKNVQVLEQELVTAHEEIEKLKEEVIDAKEKCEERLSQQKMAKHIPAKPAMKVHEKPIKQHVIEGEIKIGSTLDLSSVERIYGSAIRSVLVSYFEEINKRGGINGKKIDLSILDDAYKPERAAKNIKSLLERGIDLFLNTLGSPPLMQYLDIIKDEKAMLFFPINGASAAYNKDLHYLINFGPSYFQEGYAMMQHVFKNLGAYKKFALFYFDSSVAEGVRKALREQGINEWIELGYTPKSVNFKKQIEKLKAYDPEAIIFFAGSAVIISFIRQAGLEYFLAKKLIGGMTYQGSNYLRDFFKLNNLSYIFPFKVPNPVQSALPIVDEFRKFASKKSLPIEPISLMSYVSCKLLEKFISEVEGTLTWEKIIERAEQLNNFDMGGMTFSFDYQTRSISHNIWIDSGKRAWEKVQVGKEKIEPEKIKKEPEAIEPKIKGPIRVGSTMDLSKGIKVLGRRISAGTKLEIDAINDSGGVNERLIDLMILDDGYKTEQARSNIERFIKNNINIILNPLGGPTLEAYLDLIRERKVLVLFPKTGVWSAYSPEYVDLINFRASYYDVGYLAASYAVDQIKAKKIVIFTQVDVLGETDGARDAFKDKEFKNWVEVSYTRNDVNLKSQTAQIKAEDPDVIIFYSVTAATKALIRQLGLNFMASKKLIGATDHAEKSFKDFLKDKGLRMTIISPVPNPESPDLEIAQEFRKKGEEANVEIDPWVFESYIGSSLFIYGLQQLKGDVTKDSLRKVYEGMKDKNYKGLELDFNPATRQLQRYLWLDTGEATWKKMKVPGKPAPKKIEPVEIERQEINVGSSLDLSKSGRTLGTAFKHGITYVINKENTKNQRLKINLTILDDEYTPARALDNVKVLFTEKNADILLGPVGSPTLRYCMDYINEHDILTLFPSSASLLFRKPDLTNFINLIVSDNDASYTLIKYFFEKHNPERIALFYQNDAFGKGLLKGALKALEELNISKEKIVTVSYERNDLNFSDAVSKIRDTHVDSIALFATDTAAKSFIRQFGINEIREKKLIGGSELGSDSFRSFIKGNNLKLIISQEYPNPLDEDLPIAKAFREAAKQNDELTLENYCFGGYILARLFVEVLNKIEGKITRQKIARFLEGMKDYDFHGLSLTFNKEKRQLFNSVWIDTGEKKWKEAKVKPEVKPTIPINKKVEAEAEIEPIKKEPEPVGEAVEKAKPTTPVGKVSEAEFIEFGCTLDLKRSVRHIGRMFDKCLNYLIRKVNDEGGIHGKQMKLTVLNDSYSGAKARANIEFLLKDKIDTIIFPVGTPTLKAYVDLIKEQKILVLFPDSSASVFRKPELKNIIHLAGSGFDQGYELTKYIINNTSFKKMAFFYQNDFFGWDLLGGARKALKEYNISKDSYIDVPYEKYVLDFPDQVKSIHEAEVDTIIFFSTSRQAKFLINQLGRQKIQTKKLFGGPDLQIVQFRQFINSMGLKLITINELPNPATSTLQIAQKFRDAVEQSDGELVEDVFAFKLYIPFLLLVERLKQIEEPITNDKIIAAFEEIHDYDYGGLMLDFDMQTRQLLHSLWLNTGEPEWTKIDIAKKQSRENGVITKEPVASKVPITPSKQL